MNTKSIIITTLLLAAPSFAMAQGIWNQTSEANKKDKSSETIKINPNQTYIDEVIVPDTSGRVSFETTIKIKGKSSDEILKAFELYLNMHKEKCEKIYPGKNIINRLDGQDNIIVGKFSDELLFSSRALSRDFTRMNYHIIGICSKEELKIIVTRISYNYDEERLNQHFVAEESITDDVAVNREKNKLERSFKKFRIKTIDWRDFLFNEIRKNFEIK